MNTIPKIEISVIISTYNSPEWLNKVLTGYQYQNFKNFEILIADDGSTNKTSDLINGFKKKCNFPLLHIWHEDDGFQKTKILNKAIEASRAQYLVFSDGDCIPRRDFLQVHFDEKKKGSFLSGGYFKLPMSISQLIDTESIATQNCFDIHWLIKNGLSKSFKNNKITSQGFKAKLLNLLTPTKATWNGHNSSGWKEDIITVNGFDERMQYGGEDREMGERLFNLGVSAKQIRYSAICIHLDHERGYVKPEMIEKNKAIRAATSKNRATSTDYGIKQL